jgi:flagellar hook assembly protein FlgD
LPSRGNVQVNIYNSLGQLVRSLVNEQREAGTHSVVWDGRDNGGSAVATGAYFYQVRTGDFVQAKRMLMLK